MKLGAETGSVMNHLKSLAVIGQPDPEVGMGATILLWSDRRAGTIVEVVRSKGGKIDRICVQNDRAIRIDKNGASEDQSYRFEPNPKGMKSWFRPDRDGKWYSVSLNEETGRWRASASSRGLRIGERDEYYDFSF